MGDEVRHRITVDVRRKGFREKRGTELKTEHFSSMKELLAEIEQLLLDTFEYEEEQIFESFIYGDDDGES